MKYALGNMLNGAGGLNADQLALDLQFAADKTLTARRGPTPVLTRGSTGTFVGSNGLIQTAAVNAARFDHDPVTLASRGLLIEEGRTNLVFPSDTLTTQTRTVTAVAHTLSFYGTGTVVLSGVHSATVVGTGAYPSRQTLTFTPTAGSLTLTVTGTVQFAQLEAGSFATSYIPTTTSALARSADVCSITGANFTGMWNATEGSLFASAIFHAPATYPAAQQIVDINDTTVNNRLRVFRTTNGEPGLFQTTAGSTNVQIVSGGITTRTTQNMSAGFKLDDYVLYRNNASVGTDNLGAFIVSPTTMTIGDASSGVGTRAYLNGTISAIRYYRKRLANSKLQALTV